MSAIDRVHTFFNHPGLRKLWVHIRIPVVVLVLGLLVTQVKKDYFWIALGISLAGEFIQLWCFAALHKGKSLACRGPYAFVRNPMYLGRYFIVLGFVVLLGQTGLWLLLPYTVFYWFYMRNRVVREERHLVDVLGADYVDYCTRVNRFLPTFKGVSFQSVLFWNWAFFTRNHGWMNAIALGVVYVALYFIPPWLKTL